MFWMGLAGISFLFWSLLTWEYSFPKVGSNISEITVNTVVSSCSDSDMSHSEPTWILDLWVSVWHILLPEVILRTVGGCFLLHIMGQVKEKIYSLCVYMGEPVHESVQLSLCLCSVCIICHVLRRSYSRCIESNSVTERAGKPGWGWALASGPASGVIPVFKELEPKSIHQHSCCFCCHGKYTKGLCRQTFKIIFL